MCVCTELPDAKSLCRTSQQHSKQVCIPVMFLLSLSNLYLWERYEPCYPPNISISSNISSTESNINIGIRKVINYMEILSF